MATTVRRRALVAAALTSALALTACNTGGEASGNDNQLTIWMQTNEDSRAEAMDLMISGFQETHPDVEIVVEERNTDPHKDAMRRAAGTEAGPDIYWYWRGPGLGGELVDLGVSLDLTEYYEEYGWDDRFTEPALANITQYGGYHGVPWSVQGQGIYYNKNLFEQAGITELPTSYDELAAVADQLAAADITPMALGGTVNWHVMRLLDNLLETFCGVEVADRLNTEQAGWDSEACVTEAFTELQTWGEDYLNEGYMGVAQEDSAQLFFQGNAAMTIEGTWFNQQLVDNGMDPENVGVFLFPTDTNRIYGFGEGPYVNAMSDNPDLAAEFLDYITSAEIQEQVYQAWGAISVNREVEADTSNPLNSTWVEYFANSEGIFTNNDQNLSLEQTTEYWRIQNSVLTGDISPEDAGSTFQEFVDSSS
ncbi:extracellular solute-binding protein [Ruania alba]|uniref:Carbohydrate ABC transporter substrate-binding protein, CUT1 family n=1 Tax=Ruania alba TaxID=648782 RepID=A0A1H5KQR9_9MICO|nr:extracellular solute-binding protein [Ruania alba]SEE67219.1 carbohydrate ABC transporter substrate-binding protein, CUT1 family [Ruania alba]